MASILGLDIGKRSVRGALLKTSLRNVETESYLEVPFVHLEAEGDVDSGARVAIAELLSSLPGQPDTILCAIEGTRVSLRRVKIPETARKRAQEVLPFELDALLPFPLDEALVDYQEVETRDGQLELLAAAVHESVVSETLERLRSLGVEARELGVGPAALDGLLAHLTPPETEAWLLLDLSADYCDVCIVRNGVCELARTLDQGFATFQAEPAAFRQALQQTVMKYRADGGPGLSKLVLMGESVEPSLLMWLQTEFGVETEPLTLPVARGAGAAPSATFGKAWALAARATRRGKRLDFRRGKFAIPRGVSQLREHAVLATVCALALAVSYVFSIWAQYRVVSEERDALGKQLEQVTERHFRTATASPKRAKELLEGGGQTNDPLPRFDAFRTLAAISAAVPAGILHDTRKLEIQLDEVGQTGTFHIDGKLPDLTARDQIADALEANECIEDLERGKTSTAPGEARKTYLLEGVVACPGSAPQGKAKGKPKATKRGGKP